MSTNHGVQLMWIVSELWITAKISAQYLRQCFHISELNKIQIFLPKFIKLSVHIHNGLRY